MDTIQADVEELRKQLGIGSIQRAYRMLLSFINELRTTFAAKYGEAAVTGLYQGYLDMTYFAIVPPILKRHDLKMAIVFNYAAFRFEGWLVARNRKIQRQYWELFKDSGWNEYRIVAPASGIDAIVECDLAGEFDLGDRAALTSRIENGAAAFIDAIEKFISTHHP